MRTLLLTLFLSEACVFSVQEVCKSGQYTSAGECCKLCQPGEGVVRPCGQKQTVCEPCLDSETFSEDFSYTEPCKPCTRCSGLMRMETPCTDTNDAICVCDYGYFMGLDGKCQACTVCPVGQGVLLQCKYNRDTLCEDCVDESFSDQKSALDPCMPCTVCDEQEELEHCTPVRDTICQVDSSSSSLFPSLEPVSSLSPDNATDMPTEAASTGLDSTEVTFTDLMKTEVVPTTGLESRKLGSGLADGFIPYYISIIPAVLLGIAAFIIFKRWNSCKNSKQDGGNRSGATNLSQTPSPEGEKLHSDSGISVDSQSLQEGQGLPHTVIKIDSGSALSLPLHTREEVEKLLNCNGSGSGGGECSGASPENEWCSLAGLLGYEEERIASFRCEERPVQALLSDWASRDSANVDTLCTALRKINRDDIAQSIMVKNAATSSV